MLSYPAPFGKINRDAQAYAFTAAQARYGLERKDWAAAAALEPRLSEQFPWESSHAPYVALTRFPRGLGLAHRNRFKEAEIEAATLEEIRNQIDARSPYWATQVEIQRLGVLASILYLSGGADGGISRMREAARLEASTEKSPLIIFAYLSRRCISTCVAQ